MNEFEQAQKAQEELSDIETKKEKAESKLNKLRKHIWDVLGKPPGGYSFSSFSLGSYNKASLLGPAAVFGVAAGLTGAIAYFAFPVIITAAILIGAYYFTKK